MSDAIPKPETKRDRKLIAAAKAQTCLIHHRPADPAHVRSRGAGGPDEPWNLIPLCRACHRLQHRMGWHWFAEMSPAVSVWLRANGWEFRGQKLWHPGLVPESKRMAPQDRAAGRDK